MNAFKPENSILKFMNDVISTESLVDMCYRIDKRIEDIYSGYFDDINKSEEENTKCYINEIRYLRDEIEDNSTNLNDTSTKEKLRSTLNKVTICLDEMKHRRKELGCGMVDYDDIVDSYKNEAIFDLLG